MVIQAQSQRNRAGGGSQHNAGHDFSLGAAESTKSTRQCPGQVIEDLQTTHFLKNLAILSVEW